MNPYLIFVIRRRILILVLVPLVMVLAVLFLTPQPKAEVTKYTTKAYLTGSPEQTGSVAVEQAALEIKQDDVARAAAKEMGLTVSDPKAFAKPLKVKVQTDSLTIEVSAQNRDRDEVAEYVSAFATAFVDVSAQEVQAERAKQIDVLRSTRDVAQVELNSFLTENAVALAQPEIEPAVLSQRTVLSDRLTSAESSLRSAQDEALITPFEFKGIDPVTVVAPEKLQLPASKSVRGIMALILGILGAIGVAAFVEKLNPRVDTPAMAEKIVGASVLAQVPVIKGKRKSQIERATLTDFSGPFAESFRATRSHLDFLGTVEKLDRPPCVMVVSSAPSEGKTTTSAFLALSYAEVGREVVVVGADFRRPAVHHLFDVPRSPGLSSRMFDDGATTSDLVTQIVKRDPETGVRVIPSGPGTDRVTGLLGDLSIVTEAALQSGCTVVLDTAPVMVANDALDYLPLVDWVIVVVRLGSTTQRALTQTIQSLHLNEANIAGCVVVGSLEASDAKRYYYSYYSVDEGREARVVTAAESPLNRGFPDPTATDGDGATTAAAPVAPDPAPAAPDEAADGAQAPPSTVR